MRLVYSGMFKSLKGKKEESISIRKSTVGDILEAIEKQHPGFQKEIGKGDVIILKNGVNISGLRGLNTILTDRDTLAFSHAVLGG